MITIAVMISVPSIVKGRWIIGHKILIRLESGTWDNLFSIPESLNPIFGASKAVAQCPHCALTHVLPTRLTIQCPGSRMWYCWSYFSSAWGLHCVQGCSELCSAGLGEAGLGTCQACTLIPEISLGLLNDCVCMRAFGSSAQGFLLALYSGITRGYAWGTIWTIQRTKTYPLCYFPGS